MTKRACHCDSCTATSEREFYAIVLNPENGYWVGDDGMPADIPMMSEEEGIAQLEELGLPVPAAVRLHQRQPDEPS